MSREILFRGKHFCNGEWYEGSLLVWPNGSCMIKQFGEFPFENKNAEVQPETVGQFTGLTDKNGKRIFEGDIVKHYNRDDDPTAFDVGMIFWDAGRCQFKRTSQKIGFKPQVWNTTKSFYEVIGNRWDNPELLEVGV